MRNIKTIVKALVVGSLLILIASAAGQQQDRIIEPYVVGVTHLHLSITTWSDGSIDVSDTRELTARSARRLANRLEDVEMERRQAERSRRRAERLQPRRGSRQAEEPKREIDTQCTGLATSTGKRCRNRATLSKSGIPTTGRCYIHAKN